MTNYYLHPEDGAKASKLNLRSEYEEREYKPPFKILPLVNSGAGTYAIQDDSGMIICHSWRQGVDAERICEALNFYYSSFKDLMNESREDSQ
jgi:hypothetical protein